MAERDANKDALEKVETIIESDRDNDFIAVRVRKRLGTAPAVAAEIDFERWSLEPLSK